MEYAVGERDRQQRPDRAAVGLGGANGRRHLAIEFGLLRQQPADDTADLCVGSRAGTAERVLRQCVMQGAIGGKADGCDYEATQRDLSACCHARIPQGQSTEILLANIAPKLAFAPFRKVSSLSFWAMVVPSLGRWTARVQLAGAPTRWIGSFFCREKSTK